jgi:hypothetical protein
VIIVISGWIMIFSIFEDTFPLIDSENWYGRENLGSVEWLRVEG